MHDEIVKIKGGRKGLQLSFAEGASFDDIWKHIEQKLESGSGFFLRGTLVLVPRERFLKEEFVKLQKLFHEHGLICRTMGEEPEEEIRTESSVLVCGNVNPGAQIIAGGSIDIRGTCRGLVHAGASGDTDSFIIADHLMPTQIRIANLIARSPDHMEMTERAERASIKDGQIVIEPIER